MQQTVVKEIMDAIDFKKLLREERKRSKKITNIFRHQEIQKQSQTYDVKDSVHSIENNNNDNDGNAVVDLYYNNKWNYPIDSSGILELRELKLQSICENPKSILYSSTALQKQVITHSINNNSGDDNKAAKTEMVSISPEKALMNWLQNIPSGDSGLENWKTMNYGKRKVCMFGENTNTEYQIGQGRQQQHSSSTKLPPPLAEIAKELVKRDIFPSSYPPNHVLLNEYNPGEGILPHTGRYNAYSISNNLYELDLLFSSCLYNLIWVIYQVVLPFAVDNCILTFVFSLYDLLYRRSFLRALHCYVIIRERCSDGIFKTFKIE